MLLRVFISTFIDKPKCHPKARGPLWDVAPPVVMIHLKSPRDVHARA